MKTAKKPCLLSAQEAFIMLPDSLFKAVTEFNGLVPFSLEKRQRLVDQKEMRLEEDTGIYALSIDTQLSNESLLTIKVNTEAGVDFSIKVFNLASKKTIVGVCRRISDHCCTDSKLWFFEYNKGRLHIPTGILFNPPNLGSLLSDPNLITGLDRETMSDICFDKDSKRILFKPEIEWLGLEYQQSLADQLLESLDRSERIYEWNGRQFSLR